MDNSSIKGKLYLVATPIGNLSDFTYRAVEILNKVMFILAEDTRESAKLLKHYDIKTQMVSYRDQNHEAMMSKILEKLNMGMDLALISDSGTPNISDPGFKLVKQLRALDYEIQSIPGPSAVISAMSISGLPTDKFTFVGFLPKNENARLDILKSFGNTESTLVIYESPNRIIKLLDEILNTLGERTVAMSKDITKMHEKFYLGEPSELKKIFEQMNKIHGEYVVMIAKENFKI